MSHNPTTYAQVNETDGTPVRPNYRPRMLRTASGHLRPAASDHGEMPGPIEPSAGPLPGRYFARPDTSAVAWVQMPEYDSVQSFQPNTSVSELVHPSKRLPRRQLTVTNASKRDLEDSETESLTPSVPADPDLFLSLLEAEAAYVAPPQSRWSDSSSSTVSNSQHLFADFDGSHEKMPVSPGNSSDGLSKAWPPQLRDPDLYPSDEEEVGRSAPSRNPDLFPSDDEGDKQTRRAHAPKGKLNFVNVPHSTLCDRLHATGTHNTCDDFHDLADKYTRTPFVPPRHHRNDASWLDDDSLSSRVGFPEEQSPYRFSQTSKYEHNYLVNPLSTPGTPGSISESDRLKVPVVGSLRDFERPPTDYFSPEMTGPKEGRRRLPRPSRFKEHLDVDDQPSTSF